MFTPTGVQIGRWGQSTRWVRAAILVLWAFLLIGCSGSVKLTSQWSDQGVTVDGVALEWLDAAMYTKGLDASLGVKNDRDFLYVCLTTSSRQIQMQMLLLGCTVWFDPQGGKDKTFGIHFPIGGMSPGRRFPTRDNPEEFRRFLEIAQRELEILGPEKDQRQRFQDRLAKGVDVHLGFADGMLTYELKVPLRKSGDHPCAISADTVPTVSVGFETGELTDEARSRVAAPERAISSTPRGRSGGRSTPGGTPSIGGANQLEPLKLWATVQLAGGTAPVAK